MEQERVLTAGITDDRAILIGEIAASRTMIYALTAALADCSDDGAGLLRNVCVHLAEMKNDLSRSVTCLEPFGAFASEEEALHFRNKVHAVVEKSVTHAIETFLSAGGKVPAH